MARRLSSLSLIAAHNGLGTLDEMTDRILSYRLRATADDVQAGATWYGDDSGALLARLVGLGAPSLVHAAAATSHLSPQTSWARNVAGVVALVESGPAAAGKGGVGCMAGNVERATRALSADDPMSTFGPRALKTARFARNLLGDASVVTVDVWAARVAFPNGWGKTDVEGTLKRVGVYEATERAYQMAAHEMSEAPAATQATAWIVIRNGRAG